MNENIYFLKMMRYHLNREKKEIKSDIDRYKKSIIFFFLNNGISTRIELKLL